MTLDVDVPDVVDLTDASARGAPSGAPPSEASPPETADAEVPAPGGSDHRVSDGPPAAGAAAVGRGRRRIGSIAVACCVVLALAAGALLRSPLFRARHVQVRGAVHLTRVDVLRIAGIGTDTNVATFDAGAAERRLEADPWVEGASIAKQLPSTLVIIVHERQAVAVADIGDGPRLVAGDGTLLDVAASAELLPTIAAADPTAPALTTAAVRGAARAIAAMPLGLRRAVARVAILADGELRVDLTSGGQVVYGPAVDLTAKARALRALLAYASRQGATLASADVQVPTAPTARLVAGAPAGP